MLEAFDYTAARFWFGFFQWLLTLAVGIWCWVISRSRASAAAMGEISKRIDENSRRLDLVEKDMRDAPGHTDITALRDDVGSLRADVRELTGTIRGMNKLVDLMNEHLMNKASK